MNNDIMPRLLSAIIRTKGQAEITVTGISMNPTLMEGDLITIQKCEEYQGGDILVFDYKDEGLLIHRLLKKKNRYYCKGDNALRLEDVTPEHILGKAVLANGRPIPEWPQWKIDLSYAVSRTFTRNRYDITATKQSHIYRLYSTIILRKEDNLMKYVKTQKMDFILSDETSLAVFDPETENTYFIDETGIDILNQLETPCDLTTLLNGLCTIYAATPDDIRSDVEEFLAYTVTKGIVETV